MAMWTPALKPEGYSQKLHKWEFWPPSRLVVACHNTHYNCIANTSASKEDKGGRVNKRSHARISHPAEPNMGKSKKASSPSQTHTCSIIPYCMHSHNYAVIVSISETLATCISKVLYSLSWYRIAKARQTKFSLSSQTLWFCMQAGGHYSDFKLV